MTTKKVVVVYGKIAISGIIIALVVGFSLLILTSEGEQVPPFISERQTPLGGSLSTRRYKILHVMSYHAPWKWTDDQFNGFKYALRDLDVEYRVFQMDTKRHSTEEWKEQVGKEARDLIDTWQPDLVYLTDDNAQEYVTKYYINQDIPFVFAGVNTDPAEYGFIDGTNIAGVLEREHIVQTIGLLKTIAPDVKKIGVIVDDGITWGSVIQRLENAAEQFPEIELVHEGVIYTFEEYKQKINKYQTEVDAIASVGIFTFKDENGDNVSMEEVSKWTVENSNLPDFTFWQDRIDHGILCGVTVSGYEQGMAAGQIARGILVEGRNPASYPMEPTVKGEPVFNLARANKAGISIESQVLLTAKVVEKFAWEE